MNEQNGQQVVPGIFVSELGQATVDSSLTEVLLDLAEQLEEPTRLPVDVEHVLAAIVLAARSNELDSNKPLSVTDPGLLATLTPHVKTVFKVYGGRVGTDE